MHFRHRGVLAYGTPDLSVPGEVMAAVLAGGVGAYADGRTAAQLRSLMRSRPPIDVTVPLWRGPQAGICFHKGSALLPTEVSMPAGIPTAPVPEMFVRLAATESKSSLTRAFREADRRGMVEMRLLHDACTPGHGKRGIRPLLDLIEEALAPEPTKSDLEEKFCEFRIKHGLPAPLINEPLLGWEVDVLWAAERVVVELDSWTYHSGRFEFERDREKITALQIAGYAVIPVTSRKLERNPDQLASEIRALLEAGAAHSAHLRAA